MSTIELFLPEKERVGICICLYLDPVSFSYINLNKRNYFIDYANFQSKLPQGLNPGLDCLFPFFVEGEPTFGSKDWKRENFTPGPRLSFFSIHWSYLEASSFRYKEGPGPFLGVFILFHWNHWGNLFVGLRRAWAYLCICRVVEAGVMKWPIPWVKRWVSAFQSSRIPSRPFHRPW